MKYASIFAGIGGFDLAFERAGWELTAQVEINQHRQQVLAHHWPTVKRMGDVADVQGSDLGPIDLLVGGFPCQAVSYAAPNRDGLRDARSGNFWQFHRLLGEVQRVVDESRPEYVIIENVGGLLRSGPKTDPGADMEAVLRSLVELGYGVGARTVDSTGVGSSQRRRRIYIVGHRSGDCAVAASILALPGSGVGGAGATDTSRRRGAQRPSPVVVAGADSDEFVVWRKSVNPQTDQHYATWVRADYLNTLAASEGGYGKGTLRQRHLVLQNGRLRQLVPEEWEHGQGFPMGWTAMLPDAERFKAAGDAMNVHAASYLAKRVETTRQTLSLLPSVP